ncbi:MAG: hypothetical protein IJF45_02500, partial [Clostridia bacterium]|nr:hypothetical protein [Clostridia bacterium]
VYLYDDHITLTFDINDGTTEDVEISMDDVEQSLCENVRLNSVVGHQKRVAPQFGAPLFFAVLVESNSARARHNYIKTNTNNCTRRRAKHCRAASVSEALQGAANFPTGRFAVRIDEVCCKATHRSSHFRRRARQAGL